MATRSKSKSKSKKKIGSASRSASKGGTKSAGFGKKNLKGELQRVIGFFRRNKLEKAYAVLVELEQSYPDTPDVLVELANYYATVGNLNGYQTTCEQLIALDPHQSLFTLGLARSYLASGSPMLALKTFRRVGEQWPNHSEIDNIQKTIKELEAGVEDCLAELKVANNPEGIAIAETHEQVQCYLSRSAFEQARVVGLTLLEHSPQLLTVRNNVSMAYFFEGNVEEAIAQCHQVLDEDNGNIHALSNLIRYHYIAGDEDAAQALVPRLLTSEADAYDPWTKKMEALSYLGDYQKVLDLYDLALESGDIKESSLYDFFFHLGAVAIARVDDLGTARKIWEALNKRSTFQLAAANFADSTHTMAHRHGAWSFEFNQWGSPVMIEALTQTLEQVVEVESQANDDDDTDADIQAIFKAFLDQYPHFDRLIPIWLERGDPQSRSFAFVVAKAVQNPEHLEALKDFALGKWGPDDMRYKAAVEVAKAKLIDKQVTLWLNGQQRDVVLLAYEFHDDVSENHTPEVQELLVKSLTRLRDAQDTTKDQTELSSIYQESADLLEKAIEMEPNAPDLRNNLAVSYQGLGKQEEAIALLDQVIQDSPDYVHARTSRARAYIDEDNLDAAQDLLLPMLKWDRFHFDDFAEFSDVYIEYLMAMDQEDEAQGWLDLWKKVNPEHPKLISWFVRLTDPEELKRLIANYGNQ